MNVLAWRGFFTPKKIPTMKLIPIALGYVGYIVLCNVSLNINTVGFYQASSTYICAACVCLHGFPQGCKNAWDFVGMGIKFKPSLTLCIVCYLQIMKVRRLLPGILVPWATYFPSALGASVCCAASQHLHALFTLCWLCSGVIMCSQRAW